MLTKDIKQTIDNARNVLVGKIPNPQSQIEQITIAMIYKFMDDMDIESVELGGKREFFVEELEQYAWSKIMSQQLGNQARMNLYTEALDKLQLSNRIPKLFRDIFKGAYLPFRDGQTLTLFLKEINDLSYNNSENLGNGFEYLLSIMGSQGDAGQFRTPRHIIDFIVDVVKPTKTDTILGAVVKEFEKDGISFLPSHIYLKDLLARKGVIAGKKLNSDETKDAEFGFKMAKAIAGLDIGQTVVVKDKSVLAVESIEGTDECIKRAYSLGGKNAIAVKVAKPNQDFRFDVPVIGTRTIDTLKNNEIRAMVIEANATLILDKDIVIEKAKQADVTIVAM